MRSTTEGILDGIGSASAERDPDARTREGVFSVVVDPGTQRRRRLPSLYLGPSQVFAHRDIEQVKRRLEITIAAAVKSYEIPTYALTACRVGDSIGLYARDTFNRASYRRWLTSAGAELAQDPYVRFGDDGRFTCADWGAFEPRFVVMDYNEEDAEGVERVSAGLLAFAIASQRLGPISGPELALLTRSLRSAMGVSSDDAATLVAFLRSEM